MNHQDNPLGIKRYCALLNAGAIEASSAQLMRNMERSAAD
jgi:hypothetical protein